MPYVNALFNESVRKRGMSAWGFSYLRLWMSYHRVGVEGLSKPGFILTYNFNDLPTIED